MTSATSKTSRLETLADLLAHLGSIPPERIRLQPAPGTATEADVLTRPGGVKRLCELVDGVLVEKPMGFYESLLAAALIGWLRDFLRDHDPGVVVGPDATLRMSPGRVRLPDVSFISWDRFPGRKLPAEPVPDLVPDLAVEVLSRGNTEGEMEAKLREYFGAGVRLVWYLEPEKRRVKVYTSPESCRILTEDECLDGGDVLPGFKLPLKDWLAAAAERGRPKA